MPLADRSDYEDARFCGVLVSRPSELEHEVDIVARGSGFDFVVTPLAATPERTSANRNTLEYPEFIREDFISHDGEWSSKLVGLVSQWLDLDSEDGELHRDSRAALQMEVSWAQFTGLQAVILPRPVIFTDALGYGQALSKTLEGLSSMHVWLRLPLADDEATNTAVWRWWHTVRTLCAYSPLLGICLDVEGDDPNAWLARRWVAEPLRCLVQPIAGFVRNRKGFPVLPDARKRLVSSVLSMGIQVILAVNGSIKDAAQAAATTGPNAKPTRTAQVGIDAADVVQWLTVHVQYISYLFQRLPPLTGLDLQEFPYQDHLQLPLQPLAHNLESSTYETFEKDIPKYLLYREALQQALHDSSVRQRLASGDGDADDTPKQLPLHVMVLGAGRGPLVAAVLQAADALGVKVEVVAVEKNPCAVAVLRKRLRAPGEGWRGRVKVSELLGSFGDNELSPECIDGSQHALADDGICIPSSYTSYLAPISTHAIHASLLAMDKPERLETQMVVKLARHVVLSPPLPLFTFNHPNRTESIDNSRRGTLRFPLSGDVAPACVHGFAGYFEAVLYKKVLLSTVPATHTQDMHSWFPLFFPLRAPADVHAGEELVVGMWRVVHGSKVWYEWAMAGSHPSVIHNRGGEAAHISLDADSTLRLV